jgi:sialate O-acetylesterase
MLRFLLLPGFALALASLALPLSVFAAVTPHPLFSDHAVLQQGEATKIWGWANPGEKVSVSFRGETSETTADREGNWSLWLTTGTPGGPFDLTIRGESNVVARKDIHVGEVWLASGQSNMEWKLAWPNTSGPLTNALAEIARADHPTIRTFEVPNRVGTVPMASTGGSWTVCSPETVPQFSAIGYYFARALQEHLDVSIGIVDSTWGGTPAQSWTGEAILRERFPRYEAELESMKGLGTETSDVETSFLAKLETWYGENDIGSGDQPWFAPDLEVADWKDIGGPSNFDELELGEFDGIVWFRAEFSVPEEWMNRSVVLDLGPVDDADTTWINGTRIGSTDGHRAARLYPVVPGILRPGRNVLAVRVLDVGHNGGFQSGAKEVFLRDQTDPGNSLPLNGEWTVRTSTPLPATSPVPRNPLQNPRYPSGLYNAMIAPLVGATMRGVIWYQGESNAGDPEHYRSLFPAMVEGWRDDWNQPDWPFLFVQIAPYQNQPPEIREAQLLTWQTTDHTAMVVTLDIGEANDIHPPNKEPVGERLALAGRALVYDEAVVYSGPLYRSMEVKDDQVILSFDHVAPGLIAPLGIHGKVDGFEVAGSDGVFHPAEAWIEGDTVIVRSATVTTPTNVRYAWANVPTGNLFNRAGLPASPFRTNPPTGTAQN